MASENGFKTIKLENWFEEEILVSRVSLCFGFIIKIVIKGASTKGAIIFKFGLNISLDAILDM